MSGAASWRKRPARGPQRAAAGVTLIELIVVVVIVAILAAVAIPSYQASIQKSRRSDAKVALTASAQALERFFTERNTYAGAQTGANGIYAVSDNGYYTIAFAGGGAINTNASGYSLVATPAGAQTGDSCGAFTLDQGNNRGAAATGCW